MKRKPRPPAVLACPECGKLIALRLPTHSCSPKLPPEEIARRTAELREKYL